MDAVSQLAGGPKFIVLLKLPSLTTIAPSLGYSQNSFSTCLEPTTSATRGKAGKHKLSYRLLSTLSGPMPVHCLRSALPPSRALGTDQVSLIRPMDGVMAYVTESFWQVRIVYVDGDKVIPWLYPVCPPFGWEDQYTAVPVTDQVKAYDRLYF